MGGKHTYTGSALWLAFNSEDFSVVAAMMALAFHLEGIKHLLHYLDDLIFSVSLTSIGCVCQYISSLDERPLIILGMCLDSGTGTVLNRGQTMEIVWSIKKAYTRLLLQSFVAHLCHIQGAFSERAVLISAQTKAAPSLYISSEPKQTLVELPSEELVWSVLLLWFGMCIGCFEQVRVWCYELGTRYISL